MAKLQDDLLEVYNNLVELQENVLGEQPCPVSVTFDTGMDCLSFRCQGKGIYLRPLNYYISRPDLIRDTFLLPQDYDGLMKNLETVIKGNKLIEDRILVSPGLDGFDLYLADTRNLKRGAMFLKTFAFISGTSRWFKWKTKYRYKNIL